MQRVFSALNGAFENMMLRGTAANIKHQNSLKKGLVLPFSSSFVVAIADKENAAESRDVDKNPIAKTVNTIGIMIPPGSKSKSLKIPICPVSAPVKLYCPVS